MGAQNPSSFPKFSKLTYRQGAVGRLEFPIGVRGVVMQLHQDVGHPFEKTPLVAIGASGTIKLYRTSGKSRMSGA
jgi:hypothetical protein